MEAKLTKTQTENKMRKGDAVETTKGFKELLGYRFQGTVKMINWDTNIVRVELNCGCVKTTDLTMIKLFKSNCSH